MTFSPTSWSVGQTITFTANVVSATGKPVTNGTVTFTEASLGTLGTANVVNGKATFTYTGGFPFPGAFSVTANYNPSTTSPNFAASSSPTVTQNIVQVAVVANPSPSIINLPGDVPGHRDRRRSDAHGKRQLL